MVSHHCTRDVVVGQRNETLGQAAQRMRQSHVGDLVVVDNLENRVPIGILTDPRCFEPGIAATMRANVRRENGKYSWGEMVSTVARVGEELA